jgi:hypothetical protein
MEKLSALRDLQELSKVKLANVVYEAVNGGAVEMSVDDAGKLIKVIQAVVDDCFSLVAMQQ